MFLLWSRERWTAPPFKWYLLVLSWPMIIASLHEREATVQKCIVVLKNYFGWSLHLFSKWILDVNFSNSSPNSCLDTMFEFNFQSRFKKSGTLNFGGSRVPKTETFNFSVFLSVWQNSRKCHELLQFAHTELRSR